MRGLLDYAFSCAVFFELRQCLRAVFDDEKETRNELTILLS
jgi:hypothetical protein